ncbi:MAG: PKD domain-containing protein [Agriterribacter sp.]
MTLQSNWFKHIAFTIFMCLLCCFASLQAQVTAGIKVNGKLVYKGDTVNVCKGNTLLYESATSGSYNITWSFKGGLPGSGSGISAYTVRYDNVGFDTTAQKVDGGNGFVDSTFIIVRVSDVAPAASFNFTPDNVCGNIPIQFTNTSQGTTALTYQWSFDDNSSTTDEHPSHQFLSAVGTSGTQAFQVKLVAANQLGCKDSVTKTVTIKKIPDAAIGNAVSPDVTFGQFNGIPTFKRCENALSYTFQFTNTSTTTAINNSYTIEWGDGSPDSTFTTWATNTVIKHTFPRGNSTMTIKVTGSTGCIGIKTYNVFLGTNPSGGLTSPGNTDICSSEPLMFGIANYQNNPPGTQYIFGVNDGSADQVFQHSPPTPVTHFFAQGSCGVTSGSYNNSYLAQLIITNPCGSTSSSIVPIYVSSKPRASISIPAPSVCANTVVPIVSTSVFGNTITQTGTFTSDCSNNGKLVWEISPSTYTTNSNLGSFNNSPSNGVLWTSGASYLNVNFTAAGTYTIKLSVYNDRCGMVSTTTTLCVRNPPQASFTTSQKRICGPAAVQFTNTSPAGGCMGDTYDWDISYADPDNCDKGSGTGYSFANGTNSASTSPSISFTRSGRYIIKLTTIATNAANYCQQAYAYDTVYVVAPPSVAISNPGSICIGNSITPVATVKSCYAAGPISYTWSIPDGTPASATTLNPGAITFNVLGSHAIKLTAKDEGCNLTTAQEVSVSVISKPTAEAGINFSMCGGETKSIGAAPVSGVTYQWQPVSGISDPAIANPTVTLQYNGTANDTTYKFFVTAGQGADCSSVDSIEITVRKNPEITVSASVSICSGDTIQLTAAGAEQFTWLPAASLNTNTGDTVLAFPNTTTNYTVKGTNSSGCFASKSVEVTVRTTPVAEAGEPANICSGDTVHLGMPAREGIQYTWLPATGIVNPGISNPAAAPVYSGTGTDTSYTYYLTASLGSYCSSTDSTVITVRRSPVVSVLSAGHVICKGNTIEIAAYGAETYSWQPSQGLDNSNSNVVMATPQTTTTYTVTGSLANGCSQSAGVTITVNDHAKASFAAAEIVLCAPTRLDSIINAATFPENSSYFWYINDALIGNNNTGTFPVYTASAPSDTLQVKLVAISAAGCNNDSMQLQLITRPAVQPAFTKDKDSACGPLQVNFQNTTLPYAGTKYNWNFGNGQTSMQDQPGLIEYLSSTEYVDTVYYITLSANNGCGDVSVRDSIKVFANSQARFIASPPEGCSPFNAQFVNTSRGNNSAYYWDFGDGQKDTTYSTGNLQHLYNTGSITTYIVSLTSENRCEKNTQTVNLLVSPNLIKALVEANGNETSGCAPHMVTFNNSSVGAATLTWSFGDGTTEFTTANDQTTIAHQFVASGTYQVKVRLANNCSDTTIYRTIRVYDKPKANFTVNTPVVCPGTNAVFTNLSTQANAYEWIWGDNTGSGGSADGSHPYQLAGEYTVTLVAAQVSNGNFACRDSISKIVTVRDKIPAEISTSPFKNCVPLNFNATAANAQNAMSVQWTITNQSTMQSVLSTGSGTGYTFTEDGTYSIKLVVQTAPSCSDSVTQNLVLYNTPSISLNPLSIATCNHDTTISFTSSITYVDNDPLNYTWFVNGVTAGATSSLQYHFTAPYDAENATGFVIKSLAQNSHGCGDTSQPANVTIYPYPVPSIEVNPSAVLQQPDYTFTFTDRAPADPNEIHTWQMGDKTLQEFNGQQIQYQYGDTGTYQVKLLVVNYLTGCTARDSVNVTVLYVPGYLQVPNAMCMGCSNNALRRFLPMGNGLSEYRLRIYNAYGQVMFETRSLDANGTPNVAWDGTFNGKPLQQDSYMWQIEARFKNGTEWKGMLYPGVSYPVKSGFITVIK